MNQRAYAVYSDGYQAAARGAGVSDSPHGGMDGVLWREGVWVWMRERDERDAGKGASSLLLAGRNGTMNEVDRFGWKQKEGAT
jgi:hypothetical protein